MTSLTGIVLNLADDDSPFWIRLNRLETILRKEFEFHNAVDPPTPCVLLEAPDDRRRLIERILNGIRNITDVLQSDDKKKEMPLLDRTCWSNVQVHPYKGICPLPQPQKMVLIKGLRAERTILVLERILRLLRNNHYATKR